jgi:hypothetical protein
VSLVSTSFVAGTQQPGPPPRDQPPQLHPSSPISLSPVVLLLTHQVRGSLAAYMHALPSHRPHSQRAGERERERERGPGAVRVLELAVTVRGRSGTGALCACRAARQWWLVHCPRSRSTRGEYACATRASPADITVRFHPSPSIAAVDRFVSRARACDLGSEAPAGLPSLIA